MITFDSSGLVALANTRAPAHRRVALAIARERGPLIVPAVILGEVGHFLEQRAGQTELETLLADLENGKYTLDCGDQDFARARALVRRYADLPLGLVDAAVIACAERNGGRVLTLDLRHFGDVAREGTLTILPT